MGEEIATTQAPSASDRHSTSTVSFCGELLKARALVVAEHPPTTTSPNGFNKWASREAIIDPDTIADVRNPDATREAEEAFSSYAAMTVRSGRRPGASIFSLLSPSMDHTGRAERSAGKGYAVDVENNKAQKECPAAPSPDRIIVGRRVIDKDCVHPAWPPRTRSQDPPALACPIGVKRRHERRTQDPIP
jgi:hypothetical protein